MATTATPAALPLVAISAPEPGAPCGLTRAECRVCATLPEYLRADWRASRLAARSAVAAALEIQPRAPSTSLSHRDGRGAAVADVEGRPIGIDLERADGVPPGTDHFFLHERERPALGALGASTLWSLKEASWKALGCDDSTPFKALQLVFDDSFGLCAVELSGRRHSASAEVSTPWPGYVLSVVVLRERAT